ncbi:unnamed protein product, partial [Thlaspi arvense]
MNPSIFKLLEEDEDESMHSSDDVDAFQVSLSREIEALSETAQCYFISSVVCLGLMFAFCLLGVLIYCNYNKHSFVSEGEGSSSSQQFATQNNGIGDVNTNLHNLERTQMKEKQESVLGNQNQELKLENESHPQHNPPQEHRQQDQLWENPSHVPQARNLQSRNNPISDEPERPQLQYLKLQKTSGQRDHRVNLGPTEVQVCEFLRILMPQVNEDRKKRLMSLFYQFK